MQRNALHTAGLGSLAAEPALLERIGNALIAEVSPMWDKRDLLVTAASLACVGSGATTSLSHQLFRHLSPRLGGSPTAPLHHCTVLTAVPALVLHV
jgi:hypothetical protein